MRAQVLEIFREGLQPLRNSLHWISSLFILSRVSGKRFPAASLSGPVSIGFPAAGMSRRVVAGSDEDPDSPE